MKNFRIFHLKTFIFLVVKFSVYLNKLVLVMASVLRSDSCSIKPEHRVGKNSLLHVYFALIQIFFNFIPKSEAKRNES